MYRMFALRPGVKSAAKRIDLVCASACFMSRSGCTLSVDARCQDGVVRRHRIHCRMAAMRSKSSLSSRTPASASCRFGSSLASFQP